MGALDGMRILVTGGASGIGETTAAVLAERGATVATMDRSEIAAAPGVHVVADVTDDAAVRAGVAAAVKALGGLDGLVLCAGIGARGDVTANDDAEWQRVWDVNVMGVVRVARAALAALRASDRAAIVTISSIAAMVGLPQRAAYSSSKGAVHALTLAMAADLVGEGIRVNAVSPGTADTPWVQRLLAAADDPVAERLALEARQPHGRLVSAREVAVAAASLVSPDAGSTTGTVLSVDGGVTGLRLPPRR